MAATSGAHSQKEKYQLRWNDETLIDVSADLTNNSTTLSNMFIDVDKEPVITCCSKNIKGDDVKLYFQHYQSLLANQALPSMIDPIKLMDLLLVANYFDDSAMLSTVGRRIIITIHNVLWKTKMDKTEMANKMKAMREKFSLFPPEIQNLILGNLEKYAAIKGPCHVIRHLSIPSDKGYRMKDEKCQVKKEKYETKDEKCETKNKEYKIRDILITDQGKIIAALGFSELVSRTALNTLPFLETPPEHHLKDVEIQHIELYDELNPQQVAILNELPLYASGMINRLSPTWWYNCMGGLAANGVVWAIECIRPLKNSTSEIGSSTDYPTCEYIQYFYLPDCLRIETKGKISELISHCRVAVICPRKTTLEVNYTPEHIIDIPTGRLIRSIPSSPTKIYYDPTGQYIAEIQCFRNDGLIVELTAIDKSRLFFRSVISTSGALSPGIIGPQGQEVKIDPYRRLIYIITTENSEAPLFTLMILNFSGQMVARYRIPSYFLIYFGPDILITVESNQHKTLLSSYMVRGDPPEITDCFQSPIDIAPLETIPSIMSTISEYVIVERDVNNGWRPLVILSKIPTTVSPVCPQDLQIIFSPNGHYLLMVPPADGKLKDFTSLTIAYTRVHPAEEIEMVRKALIGTPKIKTDEHSEVKASTSSAP